MHYFIQLYCIMDAALWVLHYIQYYRTTVCKKYVVCIYRLPWQKVLGPKCPIRCNESCPGQHGLERIEVLIDEGLLVLNKYINDFGGCCVARSATSGLTILKI